MERNYENTNIRTDLAIEAREMIKEVDSELKGIEVNISNIEDIDMVITKVEVLNEEGANKIRKPIGNYITIECEAIKNNATDNKKDIVTAVSNELRKLIDSKDKTILVVGLGNQEVTPDSLGPKVIGKLLVTRHLFQQFEDVPNDDYLQKVSAITPGVMGQTGMETLEIIKGIVNTVKPDIVVAVDALASRKTSRVNSTIQIADTGVHPGSGVGNRRKGLNKETLGVPVIAVGVPTVVDAATIVNDTMEELIIQIKKAANKSDGFIDVLESMKEHEKYQLIKEVLYPYVGNMFVTPKEIDEVVMRVSDIVALSLNMAIHPKMEYEELKSWLS
jgi:spore protease